MSIKQLLGYIRQHPFLWFIGLVMPSLASLTINLGLAVSLDIYTSELFKEEALFQNIILIMGITLVVMIVAIIIEDSSRYLFDKFIIKTQNQIRNDIYSSLVKTKYQYLEQMDRGEIYTRYTVDPDVAASLISSDLFSIVFPLVHAIGYFIALFKTNILIGSIVSSLTITIMLLNMLFVKGFRTIEKDSLRFRDTLTKTFDSCVRGKISIRQMQAGDILTDKIEEHSDQIYHVGKKRIRLTFLKQITLDFLTFICSTLITPVACILASMGIIKVSMVIMITQICRFIIMQTNGFGLAIQQIGVHSISFDRINNILQLPSEYEGFENTVSMEINANEPMLVFESVQITYGDNLIVDDFNLQISAPEIIAIVGPSGSGKTSIVNALLRLIDYSGYIKLFGIDINEVSPELLRKHIAYVPEHNNLFDTTVLENLQYSNSNQQDNDIQEALSSVSLTDTSLQNQAKKLSGGQQQRVAIARAILKNSEVIILDEPTASLDTGSESVVLRTLNQLKAAGKLIILISHRESSLKIADRFLVFSDKKICEVKDFDYVASYAAIKAGENNKLIDDGQD